MVQFVRVTGLMFQRSLKRNMRNPVWTIIGMFQPVLYLLLFAPLLDSLEIPGFEGANSLNVFVPGLLVMIAIFAAGFAGFGIADDLLGGVIERFRVTPASRLALILGMLLHDVFIFLIQCMILIVIATIMGLDADLGGLIILFGLMALVGLMMASFSYAMMFILRDHGALAAMLSTVSQPLLLLSGVLLPLTLAPKLQQNLSKIDPFTYVVDAARALVDGNLDDRAIWLSFSIILALTTLMVFWATNLFRRANA